MRLYIRNCNLQTAWPPVQRRRSTPHEHSISVMIPHDAALEPELAVGGDKHKRSRSVNSSDLDDALRFFLEEESKSNPLVVETPSPDERPINLPYTPQKRQQPASNEDDLPLLEDFSSVVSMGSREDLLPRFDDVCLTPKSQVTCSQNDSLSPPPLSVPPRFVYLDVSSAIDSGLFLPDDF